jgi:fatty-acyl-CoA synthase
MYHRHHDAQKPLRTRPRPQSANYTPLTPISLIARAAYTYPRHLAVVHGSRAYTWSETYARCRRFASALAKAASASATPSR